MAGVSIQEVRVYLNALCYTIHNTFCLKDDTLPAKDNLKRRWEPQATTHQVYGLVISSNLSKAPTVRRCINVEVSVWKLWGTVFWTGALSNFWKTSPNL